MNELTHLDLFSGIGGFALAAQRAGFRTVGFSEVEPYACRILAQQWPNVPNIGDVRIRSNFDFARFRNATVLTGGFPCQPWSEAGQRRGKDDPRHLWPAMCEVIKTVRPAWIVGENVSGIIDLGLDDVLADLENAGYSAQSFNVPAVALDARHIRERIWIVANAHGRRRRSNLTTAAQRRALKKNPLDLLPSATFCSLSQPRSSFQAVNETAHCDFACRA